MKNRVRAIWRCYSCQHQWVAEPDVVPEKCPECDSTMIRTVDFTVVLD